MSASEKAAVSAPGSSKNSLLRAAGLIAVVTILSKILGFLRDWQIAYVYGVSLPTDAYYAALQIPAFSLILLGGLGGPFNTATVAVFSKLIRGNEEPDETTRRLASAFMTLTNVVFLGLSVLILLFADPLMALMLPNSKPELIQNAAEQLRIMAPVFFVGGAIGVFYGILNVYQVFFWPSFSPAAMSLVMIGVLLINPNDPTGQVLAWATVGGAFAQLLVQAPDYLKRKFSLKPVFDFKMPELRQIGELLFPAIIGTTIGQLISYVDMFFASGLQEGGWTAVVMSNRLMQLPIGVLQTALLVPIFPLFSRYVADGAFGDMKAMFKKGIVSLWFISIPLLVVLLIYTQPLIRIVFEHGRFDASATMIVSVALMFQTFQMLPYFVRDTLTRVFYAFGDARTPLLVGLFAIGLKALLNAVLVPQFGVGGITGSITLVTLFNMCVLGWLSKRHIQDLGFKEMITPFLKLCFAGVVMAAMLTGFEYGMTGVDVSDNRWFEFGKILVVSGVAFFVYALLALALKVEEVQYLFDRLKRR